MLNAECMTNVQCARAVQVCWAHHQIADPNVLSIRIVHRTVPVKHTNVKTHALVHADLMLVVTCKIIDLFVRVSKVTKVIRTPVVRPEVVSTILKTIIILLITRIILLNFCML